MNARTNDRIEFLNPDESESSRRLLDLSSTGAAFLHPADSTKGSRIRVSIKGHLLGATVMHTKKVGELFRVGLQFEALSAAMQETIADLVDEFSRGVPLTCEIVDE